MRMGCISQENVTDAQIELVFVNSRYLLRVFESTVKNVDYGSGVVTQPGDNARPVQRVFATNSFGSSGI